ncbi:MAG: hypothetical protein ABT940_13255 [Alphaproteobacteria bacterium]
MITQSSPDPLLTERTSTPPRRIRLQPKPATCYGETHVWIKHGLTIPPDQPCQCGLFTWAQSLEAA